jgi:hypothetical protein
LLTGADAIQDCDGTEFPDHFAASSHGRRVASELLQREERSRRHWQLNIRDHAGSLVSKVVFASVDRSLDHLSTPWRQSIERLCRGLSSLAEAMSETKLIVRESRALLAQAERHPYLAAIGGRRMSTVTNAPAGRSRPIREA